MKIKLAILESDKNYLMRIMSTFTMKYPEKFEIYSFTDSATALEILNSERIDVLLASDVFEIDAIKLPNRCAFAYLVDSAGINLLNNQKAICKFQKVDLIYKQILNVYSEKASQIVGSRGAGDKGQVIAFCSASGGVGSSTMAAACAAHFAAKQKKVLYLNLEKFGSSDVFFSGEGVYDMSDVIYALESKKTNLPMKLESCVKQDSSGVYFYSQTKIALDMLEMTTENIIQLISELQSLDEYDYLILDVDFSVDKDTRAILRKAQAIVLVCDGSQISNVKIERAYTALMTMEQNVDAPLVNRMSLIYNKVNSQNAHSLGTVGLKTLGGVRRYVGESKQIVEEISTMDFFDAILN